MAETPTTPVEGTQPQAISTPSAEAAPMPDLQGMSKEDLASLLDKVKAGGQQPQAVQAPLVQAPVVGKPDPLANVLQKFGLTPEQVQSNPALQKMAQSYAEAERTLSRNFQEVSNAKKENEELRRIASEYDQYIQQLKTQPPLTNQQQVNKDAIAWTPQQVEEFNADPMGFMSREIDKRAEQIVEKKLQGVQEQSAQERLLDNQIFMAAAQARQKLDGFNILEPEINKILGSGYIDKNPAAIELAYHAALGKNFPQLMVTAQNKAFEEGYQKAKSEMGKQVEVGRSSLPMGDGVFTPDSLKNLSKDQLAGMLQRVD